MAWLGIEIAGLRHGPQLPHKLNIFYFILAAHQIASFLFICARSRVLAARVKGRRVAEGVEVESANLTPATPISFKTCIMTSRSSSWSVGHLPPIRTCMWASEVLLIAHLKQIENRQKAYHWLGQPSRNAPPY